MNNKISRSPRRNVLHCSIVSLLAISATSLAADNFWTGAIDNNWNDPGNWSLGRVPIKIADPGDFDDAIVNTLANIPIITADLSATPRDIVVGRGAGNAGRIDHRAGLAVTGGGNWLYVGDDGGTGIYNLANTATTGGALTGFGTGAGSLSVQQLRVGQDAGSNGTMNINTTGTVTVNNDIFIGQNGTGVVRMDAGTINRTGGWTVFGQNAGGNGTFEMSGGTVTTNAGETIAGLAGGTGMFKLSGGTYNAGGAAWVGNDGGSNGTFMVSAGTLNVNSWFAVGRNGATGTLTISGAAVVNQGMTDAGSRLELTNFNAGGTATVNLDGGVLSTNGIVHNGGGGGNSTFNFNGGILKPMANNGGFMGGLTRTNVRSGGIIIDTNNFNITITQALLHSNIGGDNAVDGGLVKNGPGTLTISGANTFTGAVTVNAGTLYANTPNAANNRAFSFVSGITVNADATLRVGANALFGWDTTQEKPVTINAGGTMVSDNNADIAVGVVTLAGGTLASLGPSLDWGTWRFDNATDKLVATENSTASAVNVKFQNGGAIDVAAGKTLNFTGTITNSTNGGVSAVVKNGGTGTLNLTNTNTYTGSTTINSGTLLLSATGAINNSSGIVLDGGGVKLIQNSSVAITPTVTLTNGSVDGIGSIGALNVADLATNAVSNGNGAAGAPLTIGALSFFGAGRANVLLNGTAAGLQTTTLTTGGVDGAITINASNGLWNSGTTYDLISFGTLTGELADFTKGTITGLGARQSGALGTSATAITLTVTGDLPVWTGAGDATWTTAVQATKNWKLQVDGGATDFLPNDAVLFNDSATGVGTVPVSIGENVGPASTTFNNARTYTVTSAGGFGITSGPVTKNGAGTLNFGGAHTYTGPTTLNAGTTNLTGTLGNTAITIAGGATLNLQAVGAVNQNTVTVNGTLSQTVANALSGTASVVMNSGGTLTHANNHSGGTVLNSGALLINVAAGLGVGPLTVLGGTIDNTSGVPVTLSNNNAINLLADLNFTGTGAIDLGTGAVTVGSATSPQAININNNAQAGTSLTVGGNVAGGAGGAKTLNFNGTGSTAFTGSITAGGSLGMVINDNLLGTLTLSGPASSITTLNLNGGANSVLDLGAGNLTVSNGEGNVVQALNGGTINGSGSIIIGSVGADFGTAGGSTLTVNAKIAGTNRVDFYNANGGLGLGTIVLAAPNTNIGGARIENTRVVIPAGGAINAANALSGNVAIGTVADAAATLEVAGGTVNANSGGASVHVGTANNANATLIVSSGAVNAANEFWVSSGTNTKGTLNMTGGAVNSGSWFVVGRDFGTGTVNLSGGSITKGGANNTYAIIGSIAGTGTLNQTGGSMNVTAGGIRLGEYGGTTPALNALWDLQNGTSTVNGEINVAWRSSQATWNVSGASTVSATRLIVGAETHNLNVNGGPVVSGRPVGIVNISGGDVTFTGGDSRIGGEAATTNGNVNSGATGTVNVTGGNLNFGGNLQIGAFGQGTMNISGTGTVNSTGGFPVVGRFPGSVGTLNVNGGTFNQQVPGNALIVAEEGTGTLNVNSGLLDAQQVFVGHLATADGKINLNGGILSTGVIQKTNGASTALLRFNGGTLQAKTDSGDFLLGLPTASVVVDNAGAIIDTNGFNITVSQGLSAGTGTGGLTKKGGGVLILSGTSTYTGSTVVESGTLALTGSISPSSKIETKAGATLDVSSVAGGFVVGVGQIMDGNGLVNGAVTVNGTLAPGESPGTLTFINGVTLNNGSTLALEIAGSASFDKVVASDFTLNGTTNLTLSLGYTPAFGESFLVAENTGTNAIVGRLTWSGPEGELLEGENFFVGGQEFDISYAGGTGNDIVLTAVPEPGSAIVLLAGMGTVLGMRRSRRRSN